ncbi:MFS transporter [Acuticoccus mangrovi]|uniref:MFS transporter n=1 Tax=Acuticoccus mangrovi TaxID=2796142 RepID=A0A934IUA7_9HYPH|nr:MFS transporter [Acuticoccus mangrovi]MBJ3778170.1 MFS transporter [Acuticoccus mangrovi]
MNQPSDRLARKNAVVLAMAQAMGGALTSITISLGGLVGVYLLSQTGKLATLPVTTMVVGTACGTIPAGILLAKIGKRPGFVLGAFLATLGGLVAFLAIHLGSFALYCAGTFLSGSSFAFTQQYRFAAAEGASDAFRPKAISMVLAGGIFAGVIGPQTVIATKDLFLPVAYAGAYLAQAGLSLITIAILFFLYRPPSPTLKAADAPRGRPLHKVLTQPAVALAILCALTSYAVMSLVMTAAPLAMRDCGFTTANAALGIQWHVIAMFAPSFFTGTLITRFGAQTISACGLLLLALCAATALSGITLGHFYVALILLGVGWNFGFIGGTAMLTAALRPEDKARAQAANDFIVFGCVACASLSSGVLFSSVGWASINWAVFPVLTVPLVLIAVVLLTTNRRPHDRVA